MINDLDNNTTITFINTKTGELNTNESGTEL